MRLIIGILITVSFILFIIFSLSCGSDNEMAGKQEDTERITIDPPFGLSWGVNPGQVDSTLKFKLTERDHSKEFYTIYSATGKMLNYSEKEYNIKSVSAWYELTSDGTESLFSIYFIMVNEPYKSFDSFVELLSTKYGEPWTNFQKMATWRDWNDSRLTLKFLGYKSYSVQYQSYKTWEIFEKEEGTQEKTEEKPDTKGL
jgi:hypothetical protein